jgi:hypothetical protein
MTDETTSAWACPKDATAMEPMGRRGRGGAYRCPTCRGEGQSPKWAPVVSSVLMSLLATFVVRRLLRRRKGSSSQSPV